MNPIIELAKEHGPIKLMLHVLLKINEKIADGEQVPMPDLDDAIVFIREFADKCHHGKEESLLFPIMKKNNIRSEIDLIEVLAAEHSQGRGYIKNLVESLSAREENPALFAEIFLDNSKKYISLLDQHIDKENNVLFQSAKQSLSEEQIKELETGFKNVEKNIIGEGRHEELQGILKRLQGSYF